MNHQPTGYYYPPQPTPPKKKHTFGKIILGIFIAICALLSFTMCVSMCSSPAKTDEAQETAAQEASTPETESEKEISPQKTDLPEAVPQKSPDEIREEFVAGCIEADYKDIMRYPDKYIDQRVVFSGKVIQTREDTSIFTGKTITLRVRDIDDIDIVWLIQYKDKDVTTDGNILEDDIITVYGTCTGTTSYKSILGAQITIPSMTASYIDREETP